MKNSQLFDVLEKVLSRPIAFHRVFASIGGGATEGLFLSQAYYWSKHTKDDDGWFYKTGEEWEAETCLTRREQETARKSLKQLGILEEVRKGLPRKVFYRINRDVLYQAICDQSTSNPHGYQVAKSDKQASQKRQTSKSEMTSSNAINDKQECTDRTSSNVISDKLSIYTEITSEINSETTSQSVESEIELNPNTDSSPELTAPLTTNPESSGKQINPHEGINSARPASSYNKADERFTNPREFNSAKGTYKSGSADPWMATAHNPDKGFSEWVFSKRYKDKPSATLADAKAEIRNSWERASDLWEEYQSELLKKQQQIEIVVPVDTEPYKPQPQQGHRMTEEARNAFKQKLAAK